VAAVLASEAVAGAVRTFRGTVVVQATLKLDIQVTAVTEVSNAVSRIAVVVQPVSSVAGKVVIELSGTKVCAHCKLPG